MMTHNTPSSGRLRHTCTCASSWSDQSCATPPLPAAAPCRCASKVRLNPSRLGTCCQGSSSRMPSGCWAAMCGSGPALPWRFCISRERLAPRPYCRPDMPASAWLAAWLAGWLLAARRELRRCGAAAGLAAACFLAWGSAAGAAVLSFPQPRRW